jgi:oligopeptide/dipeptide ABC transporter ATP-binding protein
MNEALLTVDDLAVTYRTGWRYDSVRAVDGVNLSLDSGEIVGVVGESGSGKSTLGRALLGLTKSTAGTIRFGGRDLTHESAGRRTSGRVLQVVFQDPFSSLNPARTVGSILSEPLEIQGDLSAVAARTKIRELLLRVGLPADSMDRYPSAFSGGQRQRIAIARAVSVDPDLVICDEATSALDVVTQAKMLELLGSLSAERNMAVLFIAHDLAVVAAIAHRVVVLYQGRVMEQGPCRAILASPLHPYTRALQLSSPVPDPAVQRERRRRRADAVAASTAEVSQAIPDGGCPFAPRCPEAFSACWTNRPKNNVVGDRTVACHLFDVDFVPNPEEGDTISHE